MSQFPDWAAQLASFLKSAVAKDTPLEAYSEANLKTCRDVIAGRDFYSGNEDGESGGRMVVNISSAHIPAFCTASRSGEKAYKNGYDLGKYRIGSPESDSGLRETVDNALPLKPGIEPKDVYFGALELTGPGIRFYGDICLVLRRDVVSADDLILDRNSFDLISDPLREDINRHPAGPQREKARASEALKLAGRWDKDKGPMAALRALQTIGLRLRRYTSGQIAEAIRHDEDYIEIVKEESFGAAKLQEARYSAADAAHDALTADREANGPLPRLEALQWRERRRIAEEELRRESVKVRVVTSSGRSRD
jgi:hypothetical protein